MNKKISGGREDVIREDFQTVEARSGTGAGPDPRETEGKRAESNFP
jgi:hypothetical protein